MTIWIFSQRLLFAALMGALIGLERQWRQKIAGLRTNTLVALGSAAYTLISLALTAGNEEVYTGDSTRVIGQIVTGIGFLGGGVILRDGLNVQGLNTAATIWCSAAVGALSGCGMHWLALITAGAVAGTHLLLRPLGGWINRFPSAKEDSGIFQYVLYVSCKEHVENLIRVRIVNFIKRDNHLQLRSLKSSETISGQSAIEAQIAASGNHHSEVESLAGQLTLEYGVMEVKWEANNINEA
jgi:putative Mg2+ transporter-C (MgtC) family protein